MYLVAHQDDCQMVTGNVGIHSVATPIASDSIPPTNITVQIERGAGFRYCTCEPITVKLLSYDSWGTNYVIPQDFKDRR